VQAIERVRHAGHRGVEAEGHRGGGEVIVDGLRNADAGMPASCNCKAVLSEPSPPMMISPSTRSPSSTPRACSMISSATIALVAVGAHFRDEVALVGRAQNRAAQGHDARGLYGGPAS